MGKKSGADPDVASGVRLIGKLCGIIYYRQYRIILSADTASEVRQMLSQKPAAPPGCPHCRGGSR